MADTPEAPAIDPTLLEPLTLDVLLHHLDQATNRQRTGIYASGIGLAIAAQAAMLERKFPEYEPTQPMPDAIGFGVIDELSGVNIRTERPYEGEIDPCSEQRAS